MGRHTTPSQVEKAAEKAGKAAPVFAIAGDWPEVYLANDNTIRNPGLIDTDETPVIPSYVPKHSAPGGYAPKHAKTDAVHTTSSAGHGTIATKTTGTQARGHPWAGHKPGGTLDCSGLEQLREEAGGNPAHAFTAAEIAMAESGGNQYARAAVTISNDGADWYPWTTYINGAYRDRR